MPTDSVSFVRTFVQMTTAMTVNVNRITQTANATVHWSDEESVSWIHFINQMSHISEFARPTLCSWHDCAEKMTRINGTKHSGIFNDENCRRVTHSFFFIDLVPIGGEHGIDQIGAPGMIEFTQDKFSNQKIDRQHSATYRITVNNEIVDIRSQSGW